MSSSVAPRVLASLSPVSEASYSASLLVVAYCRRMARLMMLPSGDFNITPTPPVFFVDDHLYGSSILILVLLLL